jgi:hypothetical protein
MAGIDWVNPPSYHDSGFQALWVVGEQRNLSWAFTEVESSMNLILGQADTLLSIYYMLIIFNYAT